MRWADQARAQHSPHAGQFVRKEVAWLEPTSAHTVLA